MIAKPVRVLIANDSAVGRELLFQILSTDPAIEITSIVNDGLQAVDATCRMRPDVVAMDSQMPGLDGLEATRLIMERCPTPILIVSESTGDADAHEGTKAFRAIEVGALALVRTPPGVTDPDHDRAAAELLETLKLMAEVKVVRHWRRAPAATAPAPPLPAPAPHPPFRAVLIGASAGGPLALQQILAALPGAFPLPLLIVQHMATGFVGAFAQWLQDSSGFPVSVAVQGEQPRPGHAYLAPSDRHLGVDASGRIQLADTAPEGNVRPAVSHLFRSAALAFGAQSIAVLLTGMGRDGAAELGALRRAGAVTIAQDEQTSLVYGMPGEAVRLDAAACVLPVERIAPVLARLALDGSPAHE